MISVRIGQNGLDALRAYNPQRMYYSGPNGALALLGHCVVELVYQRAYESQLVSVATNRRYDRVRNKQGRFVTIVKTSSVTKVEYRDRTQRSVVPVNPNWLGAKYRRMLVTRDFAMLNSWGGPIFGFRPPSPHLLRPKNDTLVVWDCLWHDWRRIKLSTQPVSISAVIPTTVYPGMETGAVPDDEARRLIEIQKQVLFSIYEANFHNKKNALFSYMDNRMQLGIQQQEETLRKKHFKEYDDHQEELRKRRERYAERQRKKREEAERLRMEQEQRQMEQEQLQQMQNEEEAVQKQEVNDANEMAEDRSNMERPGNVEIQPEGQSEMDETMEDTGDEQVDAGITNNRRIRFK